MRSVDILYCTVSGATKVGARGYCTIILLGGPGPPKLLKQHWFFNMDNYIAFCFLELKTKYGMFLCLHSLYNIS